LAKSTQSLRVRVPFSTTPWLPSPVCTGTSVTFHVLRLRTSRFAVKVLLVSSASGIAFVGSTVATTCVPGCIHAAGTAAFHDAAAFSGSMLSGTEVDPALMVNVLVVEPLIKSTLTCGATELDWFALANTRTQELRFCTSGSTGFGYSCVAWVTYRPSMVRSSVAPEEFTVKLLADVAVPHAVVTAIVPLVVPLATTAVIWVALFTAKLDAALPLNVTAVAPLKLLPAITTGVPTGPVPGLNPEIEGGVVTLKLVAEVAVPSGVVTAMVPVVVPLATVADRCASLLTVKLLAALPLKATAVAPVKLAPVITTVVPTGPLAGLKLNMVGGAVTTKLLAEVAVPPGVVRLIFPLLEPLATTAVTCVALFTEKLEAAIPPNVTAVAPVRFVPVMVTEVPDAPDAGAKLAMAGAGVTGWEVELPPPQAARARTSAMTKARSAREQSEATHNVL